MSSLNYDNWNLTAAEINDNNPICSSTGKRQAYRVEPTEDGRSVRYLLDVPAEHTFFWSQEGWGWAGYRYHAPAKWSAFQRRSLLRQGIEQLRAEMALPGRRFSRRFWAEIEWLLAACEQFLAGNLDGVTADSAARCLNELCGYRTEDGKYCFLKSSQTLSSIAANLMYSAAGFSLD